MRVFKKSGTKERLFEMFENVNKIKLNETDDYVDPIAAARTSGERNYNNQRFSELSANNYQGFKDEYGIPHDVFNSMSDQEKKEELWNYLSINELEIPRDAVKTGARIPIKDISPETFPVGQNLPSYDTADAQQEMNSVGAIMRWKGNFIKRFGEEGDVVKSDAWWWNIEGNPKYEEWKDRGINTKAAAIDVDREKGYKFHDNYDPKINESDNVNQEIDDELDMRYSHSTKTIPYDEINDVAEMYGVDFEIAAQIAADVIARNQSQGDEEITDDVKELVKRMHDTDVDPNKYSVKSIWQVCDKEYEAGSEFNEFKEIWDKLTKDPNQMKMFEGDVDFNAEITPHDDNSKPEGGRQYTSNGLKDDNPELDSIKYKYDQKGNWIPQGYEDKKVGLRSLEQSIGSDNWKVALVTLDDMGDLLNIVDVKDSWDEAKDALHSSIT